MFSGNSYDVYMYFEILHCLKAGDSIETETFSMQREKLSSDLVYKTL